MLEIKILFNGVGYRYEKNGIKYIDGISSSVTLLKVNSQLILIDSGSPIYEEKLLSVLKENSIKPEDINWIIETHLHPDHVGNNHLFKNAKRVEGNWMLDFKNKLYTGWKRNSDVPLPKEIEIINTPGHTLPHFSVIIEKDNRNIVFSGDAIKPEMLNDDYLPNGEDIPKIIDSALKICAIADEIVPGHGSVLGKEEIGKIKNNLLKLKNK